jgi:hypothetical protein
MEGCRGEEGIGEGDRRQRDPERKGVLPAPPPPMWLIGADGLGKGKVRVRLLGFFLHISSISIKLGFLGFYGLCFDG